MPNYDFKKDVVIGKATEKEIAELLTKIWGAEILGFNDDNRYDFKARIKGEEWTFETKEDFLCEQTGNVGLEFECRGKPSGIQTTQADFYIYKLHTTNGIEYVIFPVKKIKKMIETKKYFRIVNGGDKNSNSMNYLFKYNVFVKGGRILPLDKMS